MSPLVQCKSLRKFLGQCSGPDQVLSPRCNSHPTPPLGWEAFVSPFDGASLIEMGGFITKILAYQDAHIENPIGHHNSYLISKWEG